MAGALALCIVAFVVAYAGIDPFTRDFIAASTPTPTATSGGSGEVASNNSTRTPSNNDTNTDSNSNNSESNANPTEPPSPTQTPTGFTPDYLSNSEQGVNFRSGPGTDNDVLLVLDASTPLKSTGKQEADGDGTVWMEFETRDGTTGWIRQIDAVQSN